MKYAIISNTLQNDGSYEQERIRIVSAQSAKEALWRAGINNTVPGYGRFYEAVPVKRYSAHIGGPYNVTLERKDNNDHENYFQPQWRCRF